MKRQKRDKSALLYNRGFQAGLAGRSRDNCPVSELALRSHWMNGWRQGREAHWDGMTGVAAIQSHPALH